jgi:uncharacterized protein (DUF3084 family)
MGRNGNEQLATVKPGTPTPEELAVAHGIANYHRVVTERDELQKQLDRKDQTLTVNKIEIEALRAELSATHTRSASYQHERDDAVANLAVYQTLFMSVMAQMRTFGIENAPLVKEKAHVPPAA